MSEPLGGVVFVLVMGLYLTLFLLFVRRTLKHGRLTTTFLVGSCLGWAGWAADRLDLMSEHAAVLTLAVGLFFGCVAAAAMATGGRQ